MSAFDIILVIALLLFFTWEIITYCRILNKFNDFTTKYENDRKLLIKNDKILEKDLSSIFMLEKKYTDTLNRLLANIKTINVSIDNAGKIYKTINIESLENEATNLKRVNKTLVLELDNMTKKYKEAIEKLEKEAN